MSVNYTFINRLAEKQTKENQDFMYKIISDPSYTKSLMGLTSEASQKIMNTSLIDLAGEEWVTK